MSEMCDNCSKNMEEEVDNMVFPCEKCAKQICINCSLPDCDWCLYTRKVCNSCMYCNKQVKLCSGNSICMLSVISGVDSGEIAYCETHENLTYRDNINPICSVIRKRNIVEQKYQELFAIEITLLD